MKKKKNAILKSQIDQYEKILEEVSKEKDGNESSMLPDFADKSVDKHVNFSQQGDAQMLNESHAESFKRYSFIKMNFLTF